MVANYWAVANLAKSITPFGSCLVTFRCLKHFLHFDAPLCSWFDVISSFFWQKDSTINAPDREQIKDARLHASAELRHWSGILFQLIVGFFSIFGALVYFSLPEILNEKSGAPYYLASYSILTSFFLILLCLYFFYVNRVNVFLKHHIEPYISSISWTAYRTTKFFSGH